VKSSGKSVLEGSDYSSDWEETWPPLNPSGTASVMPMAVEITIEVEGVGRSTRLFELPQPVK
jgi:general secretion pathway protein J